MGSFVMWFRCNLGHPNAIVWWIYSSVDSWNCERYKMFFGEKLLVVFILLSGHLVNYQWLQSGSGRIFSDIVMSCWVQRMANWRTVLKRGVSSPLLLLTERNPYVKAARGKEGYLHFNLQVPQKWPFLEDVKNIEPLLLLNTSSYFVDLIKSNTSPIQSQKFLY